MRAASCLPGRKCHIVWQTSDEVKNITFNPDLVGYFEPGCTWLAEWLKANYLTFEKWKRINVYLNDILAIQ